ncbi:MAG: polyhydroxyalkanoate synthesis regulator DNA-binding domain-containing protein [Candidatus Eisenbacteria bacterium]|nr:polyhydroxyalkanoate synthesis regulator DNA-binding domain-containing protein [Candidatus Eisenbacteria bacterium]
MRTIIKHANRRLYDSSERKVITLLEVSELVVAGESISVVDKATGEDITVVTLLQSVLERLKRRSSEGLGEEDAERLVAALRTAMAAGSEGGDSYDSEAEAGRGTSTGAAGRAA